MTGAAGSAPAKFRPRGVVADIDDATLADGYYYAAYGSTASSPDNGFFVGDWAVFTQRTIDGPSGYQVRVQEYHCFNSSSLKQRTFTRSGRNVGGWLMGAWESERNTWSNLTLVDFWNDTGDYAKWRRVGGRIDVNFSCKNTNTSSDQICSLGSANAPPITLYFPVTFVLGAFYESGRLSVNTSGEIHIDVAPAAADIQWTAAFSYVPEYGT